MLELKLMYNGKIGHSIDSPQNMYRVNNHLSVMCEESFAR